MRTSTRRLVPLAAAVAAACLIATSSAFVPSRPSSSAARFSSRSSIPAAATATTKTARAMSMLPDLPEIASSSSTWCDVVSSLGLPLTTSPEQLSSALLHAMGLPTSSSLTTTTTLSADAILSTLTNANLDVDAIRHLASAIVTQSLLTQPWHAVAIGAFALGNLLLYIVTSPNDFSQETAPYAPGTTTYSPEKAEEFYAARPFLVFTRVLKLAVLTSTFNAGLLFDWLILGKLMKDEEYTALRKNEPERAKKALILCQQLGPTFIKLGQALSIRTDLIPEPYALELRQLQDAVPPFSSVEAREVLRRELGVSDLSEVFTELSDEPVASASIGQVYRGTLKSNGKDVAVKVQRPGILAEIALDLHVLRILTPIQTTLQNAANGLKTTQEDIDTAVLLVDEWGRGFVAETDYNLEARNTIEFEKAMRKRGLDAVCAPTVVEEYTRDNVLVTEWIEGTRLDRDASPDVPRLCGVAINAYLTMLLDTGVLHCDPHPGNLLRTTDGRLCILDWGMTLEVPSDLQYALLELIAHINVEDYDAIPQDFINLKFTPPNVTPEKLKSSGITEGLSFAFRQLSAGGGPAKIQERVKAEFQERYGSELSDDELRQAARADMLQRMEDQLASEGVDVKGVTNVMEEMSRRNRELFAVPPYVLYVARAFSTLEGIGLSIDENYAIVQECYPYLARRLFTDRSPRAKAALRSMLGLPEEVDGVDETGSATTSSPSSGLAAVQAGTAAAVVNGDGVVDAKRGALSPGKLIEMSEGFASYTAATAEVDRDGAGQAAAAAELTKLLLDPEGSTLQEILVEETARLGDAGTRAVLRNALIENAAAQFAKSALCAPKELLERNERLSNALPGAVKEALVDRPASLPGIIEELLAQSPEDEKVLASARELSEVLGPRLLGGDGGDGSSSNLRSAVAGQLSDGASAVPSPPSSPVASLLADEETRKAVVEQLPGVATLGRRIGAGLLRRAAMRADRASVLPEEARRALKDANTALADVVEPTTKEEDR